MTVYPRVGGGNENPPPRAIHGWGLSPRGRGKRQRRISPRESRGSIPAWAGETRLVSLCLELGEVYPRVGGGNTGNAVSFPFSGGLSPRGRGKPRRGLG